MTNEEEQLLEETEETPADESEITEEDVSADENSETADPAKPAETADKAELDAVKEQLLRTMAEYDNFRKRSAREKDALRAEIVLNVTSKFLPVLDNLERALETECSDENYKKGVEMIGSSFLSTLKDLGVEEIASDGAPFDPNLHQAVQRVDGGDAESGTVVQTFAKGYKIGDRVIRFAMVSVAN